MYQLRGKNLADSFAMYGRGRENFRPPTYIPQAGRVFEFLLGVWLSLFVFPCDLALSLIPILTELT